MRVAKQSLSVAHRIIELHESGKKEQYRPWLVHLTTMLAESEDTTVDLYLRSDAYGKLYYTEFTVSEDKYEVGVAAYTWQDKEFGHLRSNIAYMYVKGPVNTNRVEISAPNMRESDDIVNAIVSKYASYLLAHIEASKDIPQDTMAITVDDND